MHTPLLTARCILTNACGCALLLLIGSCCNSSNADSAEAKLFEDGPLILYTTYGQYVELDTTDYDPPEFHAGIDIGACPDGKSRVLALEEGYVVKSSFESPEPLPADYTRHYVIISRGEDRSRGILYAHLADTALAERQKVSRGDYVGSVVNWETSGFDHLHLQLVSRYDSGAGTDEVWASGEAKDDGNPLLELTACFEDDDPPTVEEVPSPSGPVAFEFLKPNGDPLPAAGLTGSIVIVARLHDQCSDNAPLECTRSSPPEVIASQVVAPLSFELSVRCTSDTSVAEKVFSLDLKRDVRDKLITDVYHSGTIGTYSERSLRFNLTYDPSNGCAWTPTKSGAYELALTVEDAAGLKTNLPPFAVTVL